ncbi:hypothetical protein Ctha_0052 [Chloroherpeton thalassium ATCC 35110]|uniref:Uncharacterized protein n=1 Tax=Chloroherpeton thalassium (strain ATCC 35110 / GB-78) TaxID=517418 RepID=B3QSD2_CHLT3|nr:hypothetical protein [Chloroherpeton thalassium]ACF12523.1 hypothetical protein Ctha_0052 [Chloroherpeton thalassium ATCC 35110]
MRVNIKITSPKEFHFKNGAPEVDATVIKTTELMSQKAGSLAHAILTEISPALALRTVSGNLLLLLPETNQGMNQMIKGHAIWAKVFLIPFGTKEGAGFYEDEKLTLLGRAMVAVVKSKELL